MQRLKPIDPSVAEGRTKMLMDKVHLALGSVPNIVRTMANAPAALEGYLELSGALSKGVLSPRLREQIALVVAEANGCEYCVAAHTALGKGAGLTACELLDARRGQSEAVLEQVVLRFAGTLVLSRGRVEDHDLTALRAAGVGDREITEIVAHVALNVFTNYFNHVAGTEVDFPAVQEIQHVG